MTDDNDDGIMLSRRDAIRGGAALGTMALASRIGAYAQVVEAQITEPRIQLGSDYAIHDSGGSLVINHDPNGDILEYDASTDQITTLKPLTSITTDTITVVESVDKVRLSANQTIGTTSVTKIEFDVLVDNTLGVYNTTNNVWNIDQDGTYFISAMAKWVGSATWSQGDRMTIRFNVNGSIAHDPEARKVAPSDNESQFVADVVTLSDGDTVQVDAFQDSGNDQELNGSPQNVTTAVIAKIG